MKSMAFAVGLAMIVATAHHAVAQSWKVSSDVHLTLTQNAYSDNWVGGESGSMSWTLTSLTVAEKQVLATVFNQNTLKLSYGLTYNQNPQTDKWGSGDKSTDLIDLESTYRITLGTFVEPIVAFRVITQFLDQSDPTKDRWINPLDLTESVGGAKVFIKDEERQWQTRLGIAARQIIDRDLLDPLSGTRSTETEISVGVELVNDLTTPISEDRILLTSKLTVFQGFFSTARDDFRGTPQEDDWKYPDINFENIFSASITRHIEVNLYVQLLFDRQIDRGVRFKQTLSLALAYNLL
ncbi:MAG: DUF3078 domain-containing protein [Candidatus Krumholzibacteria bacterium]